MLLGTSQSNLTCEAGCGLRFHSRIILGSCSDHGRIGPALEMTFHLFLEIFFDILQCLFRGRCSIWGGWIVTPLAPRIGNDVSYVRTIQQSSHFSWQVQYLVKFKQVD